MTAHGALGAATAWAGPVGNAALALGDEGAEVVEVRLGRRHELERGEVVGDVRQVAGAHARDERAQRVAQRLRLDERVRDALLPVVTHLVQPAARTPHLPASAMRATLGWCGDARMLRRRHGGRAGAQAGGAGGVRTRCRR